MAELWTRAAADAVNPVPYVVRTAADHLASLNRKA